MRISAKSAKCLLSALVPLLLLASPLTLGGCGGQNLSDYRKEVTDINQHASQLLAGSPENASEHIDEESTLYTPQQIGELEEMLPALEEALSELQEIKVPSGWEEFHRKLIELYHAQILALEEVLAVCQGEQDHHQTAETEAEGEEHEQQGTPPHQEPAETEEPGKAH
jgi:hypothetical protein